MSRYTGPTIRINRKYKAAIFPMKKAYDRKPYAPGIHGARLRKRLSDFAIGLAEKQKLRYMYGLTEKQFRLTFSKAKNQKGVTGENFLRLLDCRLDNVVYCLGFAKTRKAARQLVNHGHVRVNGQKVDIPSFSCTPGDKVHIREKISSKQLVTRSVEIMQYRSCPVWMVVNADTLEGEIKRYPERDEMTQDINEQLIVEFYSR